MPVPRVASAEALLRIDPALMEIHLVSQQLSHGVDQSRQKTQAPEWLGIGMGAEGETDADLVLSLPDPECHDPVEGPRPR